MNRISCVLFSHVLRYIKFCILFFKKFVVQNRNIPIVIEEVEIEEYYEIPHDTINQNEIVLYKSLNMRSKSYKTVHLDMRSTKSYDTIYIYDFQTRVAQMFANDNKISSFLEPNLVESVELEDLHEEVPGEEADGLDDRKMNIFGECSPTSAVGCFNTDPLYPTIDGPILSDTELELEFLQSSSVSSSPASIHPRLNEYSLSTSGSNSSPFAYGTLNQVCPSLGSYTTAVVMDHQHVHKSSEEEEVDFFYKKYAESMSWFDDLNHERLYAISAVLRNHLSSPNSLEWEVESTGLPVQYISLSKVARKRLVKSLESDLELVYVAQSCLSWEALHHQYRKVKALCSISQNWVFHGNLAAKFQKFQILLERFVEDDRCGGKRHLNYVHRRFSQRSLLQVPDVSGYVESNELRVTHGETSKAMDVLKAIEKCINAFWYYIRADIKRTSWKRKNLSWNPSRVEDPRDIGLLYDLTRKLQAKELWLKDLKGKRRCWLRKAIKPQQLGDQCTKIEFVFTMIDMKLVSRVLHMSNISTTHLKWCQHKLDNIHFKDGQVLRTPTSLLFPS